MKLQILENEYWWGGIVHEGIRMPFGREAKRISLIGWRIQPTTMKALC